MTTKGYHRYRGRNTRGKVALVVVLVLILLAAGASVGSGCDMILYKKGCCTHGAAAFFCLRM